MSLRTASLVVSINCAVLIVLLALVELGLRVSVITSPVAFSSIYTQTWPGLKRTATYTLYKGDYRSRDVIDFRNKSKKTLRILCIGASTTAQITQDFDLTWCGTLQSLLEKSFPKTQFEMAIFGKPGWAAIDNLLWEEINLVKANPDLVITLLGINDVAWNGYGSYEYNNLTEKKQSWRLFKSSIGLGDPPDLADPALSEPIEWSTILGKAFHNHECHICNRISNIKIAINNMLETRPSDLEDSKDGIERRLSLPLSYALNRHPDPFIEFRDVITAMNELHKQHNIPLIMLGQPVLWADNDPDPNENLYWFSMNDRDGTKRLPSSMQSNLMRKYNEAQKIISTRYGHGYVELNGIIPKSPEYFLDDCHFTDKGSQTVALAVFPIVRDMVSLLKPATDVN